MVRPKFNRNIEKRYHGKDSIPYKLACQMIIWAALENPKLCLLLNLGFHAGLRHSDLVRVTKDQLISGKIELQAKKTGKPEKRNLPDQFYDLCKQCNIYLGKLDKLPFMNHYKTGFITSGYVARKMKKILRDMSVDEEIVKNTATHTMRKTFATELHRILGGGDEATNQVGRLLGHESTRETILYLGLDDEIINNAVSQFGK